MARRHLAVALPVAAVKDAVALVSTVARFVVLEPSLCALVGHRERVVACPEPRAFCLRCGRERRAG